MTWYASHIYAEAKPLIRSIFLAHPLLAQSVYEFSSADLPPTGLLVVREVIANQHIDDNPYNTAFEARWQSSSKNPVIPAENISALENAEIILPPQLPILAFDAIVPKREPDPYPPIGFLRYLKKLSQTTSTTISYYHHETGAERAVDQEFAWVFGAEDCVYVRHIEHPYRTVKYWQGALSEVSKELRQSVLMFVLQHFGIQLPNSYFAPHTRRFDWEKHHVTVQ